MNEKLYPNLNNFSQICEEILNGKFEEGNSLNNSINNIILISSFYEEYKIFKIVQQYQKSLIKSSKF